MLAREHLKHASMLAQEHLKHASMQRQGRSLADSL